MKESKARLAFFVSHGGSNFQAIVSACKEGRLNADPAIVIYNNPKAAVKDKAQSLGVKALCLNRKNSGGEAALDQKIFNCLQDEQVDLILLCGYMRKIGEKVLENYQGRILNIHPALLPKFGGKGMYGIRVHQAVIEAGEEYTGATIHIVTADYDEGPIVAQVKVKVEPLDDAESLADKVLRLEHQLYSKTIQKIICNDLKLPEPGDSVLRKSIKANT